MCRFQSTPLREGRPEYILPIFYLRSFNPRPCARGDLSPWPTGSSRCGFNPRPCARGDGRGQGDVQRQRVSIHAPARGATQGPCGRTPRRRFQSTPLREGRRKGLAGVLLGEGFNPRPCARGDTRCGRVADTPRCFNPRPCARGDDSFARFVEVPVRVSIHAPARGATRVPSEKLLPVLVSIHAPARGATRLGFFFDFGWYVSIHAPARGAT